MMHNWDRRFLTMAKEVASWSKDPGTKCGAVIVSWDNRVISVGFNGFAQGIQDKYLGREEKLIKTLHAEENAIIIAAQPLNGCKIYTYPFMPCGHCSSAIIQANIYKAIAVGPEPERWRESCDIARSQFAERKIGLTIYPIEELENDENTSRVSRVDGGSNQGRSGAIAEKFWKFIHSFGR